MRGRFVQALSEIGVVGLYYWLRIKKVREPGSRARSRVTSAWDWYSIFICDYESGMHFNIYLDDKTGQQLTAAARERGENRNAVIRQAVQEWLRRGGRREWPAAVLAHDGDPEMPPFEAGREHLTPPVADPLA
jgi:hypothetical protein